MSLPDPDNWLTPDWSPHPRVCARVTTRGGTFSPPPWHGFNLGANCGDEPARVSRARAWVHQALATPAAPHWLHQVHGTGIVEAGSEHHEADGVWTSRSGLPCAVLTADCLPVLIARTDGSRVGAFHAGWRGLLAGILELGATRLAPAGESLAAWIGPGICPACYQVDATVHDAFVKLDRDAEAGFSVDGPDHWRMDLPLLARQRLQRVGVLEVGGGKLCTHCHGDRFYSYRYEGCTGRFATLIWLNK